MGIVALETGRALRRARRARQLTLRQVASMSGGRFKATSIAGYERGERAISLERFSELCRLYGIPPGTLLAEIVRDVQRTNTSAVHVTDLESLGSEEAALVAGFVRHIRELRSNLPPETIALRAGDLEVLASAAGRELTHSQHDTRARPQPDEPPVRST